MNPDLERSIVALRSRQMISERFASETLVLDPQSERYVRLNEVGSRLWEALDGPVRAEDLVAILVAEWGLSEQRAHEDVVTFLRSLAERGLIELTQP